jgi:hypothetical protein
MYEKNVRVLMHKSLNEDESDLFELDRDISKILKIAKGSKSSSVPSKLKSRSFSGCEVRLIRPSACRQDRTKKSRQR